MRISADLCLLPKPYSLTASCIMSSIFKVHATHKLTYSMSPSKKRPRSGYRRGNADCTSYWRRHRVWGFLVGDGVVAGLQCLRERRQRLNNPWVGTQNSSKQSRQELQIQQSFSACTPASRKWFGGVPMRIKAAWCVCCITEGGSGRTLWKGHGLCRGTFHRLMVDLTAIKISTRSQW